MNGGSPAGSFIGLFLIAVGTRPDPYLHNRFFVSLTELAAGTGGIKPCVSSFGGDQVNTQLQNRNSAEHDSRAQFSRTQENLLRMFFSIFYFAINAGRSVPSPSYPNPISVHNLTPTSRLRSVIATFITPELRASPCFGDSTTPILFFGSHSITGESTCYPWAFGLPAILMIVALALFLFGKSKYKRLPPSGSVVPTIIKGAAQLQHY